MSSIVSRSPEVFRDAGSLGSPMNQRNDAFWMSIRLGTSSTFPSFEKVLRTRGEVVSGKAKPPGRARRGIRLVGSGPRAQPRTLAGGDCSCKQGRATPPAGWASADGVPVGHYTRSCRTVKSRFPGSENGIRAPRVVPSQATSAELPRSALGVRMRLRHDRGERHAEGALEGTAH